MVLKIACPRKTQKARKTQNKLGHFIGLSIQPLGDNLQLATISLEIFVIFVFFVDEMIFPG